MGAIAASGARELFLNVMIASASIPGVVSPVLIDVEADGQRFQEMHVDGGVISQFFLYPPFLLPELRRTLGPVRRELHAYIIRNGRLAPEWSDTPRSTLSIGQRAVEALVASQGINDLYRVSNLAQQDDLDLRVAYIAPEFTAPHPREYDSAYMKALFAYGHDLAASGTAWHRELPLEPPPQIRKAAPLDFDVADWLRGIQGSMRRPPVR